MWIILTTDDIDRALSAPEKAAIGKLATGSTQPDPWTAILASVTREVRGYVAAHKLNRLGTGATIPDELSDAAVSLAVYYGISRLPIKVSDVRKTAYDNALSLLRRVADGGFLIAQPTDVSTDTIASTPIQVVGHRTRIAGGRQLSGL